MAPPTTITGTATGSLSQTSIVTMNTRADEEAEMEVEVDSLGRGPNQLKGWLHLGNPQVPVVLRAPEAHCRSYMAAMFRNWARVGFTEGISGHISVRDPEHHGVILRRAKAL
ncbi:aldolase, partial [Metarhizium hybridum]